MTLHISVTAEDIALGGFGAGNCPVALASQRALVEAGNSDLIVSVTQAYIRFRTISNVEGVKVDIEGTTAAAWIKSYDDGKPVLPFEFDIEVPS